MPSDSRIIVQAEADAVQNGMRLTTKTSFTMQSLNISGSNVTRLNTQRGARVPAIQRA